MKEYLENTTDGECLNCHQQLPVNATFCPNCGQKTTTGLISLKEFFQNFLDNVFNLNSRIVQTIKWLFIPAKLTKEYFKGKHKTYYHPIRLYLVLSLIFFATLNFIANVDDVVNINLGEEGKLEDSVAKEAYKITFLEEIDTRSEQIALFKDSTAKVALDSLKKIMSKTLEEKDSFNITLAGGVKYFDYTDVVTLNGKELVEKYKIEGFWNQIFTKQVIHFVHDQASFARQLINNFPLMLLAMMPFLALFMKLLYIRRNRFYVEHLVLNFHHHAFAFLLLTLLFLIPETHREYFILPVIAAIFIFLYFTMKRYYGQGYVKTLLKYMAFNFFYLFSFLVVLVITFMISFLLF